jgi:hypothetical protein
MMFFFFFPFFFLSLFFGCVWIVRYQGLEDGKMIFTDCARWIVWGMLVGLVLVVFV